VRKEERKRRYRIGKKESKDILSQKTYFLENIFIF